MGPVLEIGDRFIRHVYILTICLTVVISAVLLGFKRDALPSFLIGSAISLSLFWSIEFCGSATCSTRQKRSARNTCLVSSQSVNTQYLGESSISCLKWSG